LRKFGHWTPQYIYDRLKLAAYERTHPTAPWLTRTMVELLASWLRPEDQGFEWGSGRSTIWFAERVASMVSVEHNPEWHRRVSAELKGKGIKNVDYYLRQDEDAYSRMTSNFSPSSFDFCLVDGVARDRCALSALPLVRPGGIVIVDNCNWFLPTDTRSPFSRGPEQGPDTEFWATYQDSVKGWRTIWTTNGVFDTALWVKPAGTNGCVPEVRKQQ
jgi:predicted O-methyltransferase YrrM